MGTARLADSSDNYDPYLAWLKFSTETNVEEKERRESILIEENPCKLSSQRRSEIK